MEGESRKMSLKDKVKEVVLGYRASSDSYVKHLRKIGVEIGEDVVLFRPYNTTIDMQNPHLLTIGNHVMITGPVTILTNDYGWSVIKRKYGEILGNQKSVSIGDNVFLGWGCTILAGTTIGANTIIGANSVCSGKIDENSVYAGNPAKKIMTLEEYYLKRKTKQKQEACAFVKDYYNRFHEFPSEDLLSEYFFLFTKKDDIELINKYKSKLILMGNYDKSVEALSEKPEFDGWKDFIEYCKQDLKERE